MNIVISEKDSIEKKAKIIYEDLKKATKNLELLINQEKNKKNNKKINKIKKIDTQQAMKLKNEENSTKKSKT